METNTTPTEETKTLEIEIKEFINAQPYWAQYICAQILEGNNVSDEVIETTFQYLLEDLLLKEETEKPELSFSYNVNASNDYKEEITLDSLEHVEGVNALSENQKIELTPNLTIVYGANGSGKSGYVRLLKNSFYSKDKESILPNINIASGHKPISATFNFSSNSISIPLKYPDNNGNGIFSQFAVFDGNVGKKHLSNRNNFIFRPAGLNLFNEFNLALEKLNTRLNKELETKSIANPFAEDDIFQGDSIIKTFLIELSEDSNLDILKQNLPYTEIEKTTKVDIEKKYDDLKIALAQKDKSLKKLQNIKELLTTKRQNLETINLRFCENQINILNTSIDNFKEKEIIAQKEGVEKFKTEKLQAIGSKEWKNFIISAEKFALLEKQVEYPSIGDYCLFCHQPINDDATKNLILSYWDYIKSVAEQEAKIAKQNIEKLNSGYNNLDLNQFPDSDTLTVWLKDKYIKEFLKIEKELDSQLALKTTIIDCLNKQNKISATETQIDLTICDTILENIEKEINDFENDEQNTNLEKLLKEKTYLAHKEKLETRYPDIEKLYKNMIWVSKSNLFNKQHFKSQSTNTEKRLSKEYFNTDYIEAFNDECKRLNGNFGIDIDAKSTDAQSNRQLFLKGKDPSSILSEGEQKVIALADFIAETNITRINKGVIFDDPVTSLDDERKSNIAERLVTISEAKQVLIFTHDLIFVSSLINFATEKTLQQECHWIENRDGNPGQIWLRNAPSYEKLYRNAEPAKKYYTEANKSNCSPELRESCLKSGFTALRTCYEVLVINELFCNVVQRYNERVSVDSLASVKFTEDVKNELLDNFGQCCRYMEGHSHSDKYAYRKPIPQNLNEEIERYEEIRKKIKELKK